MAGQRVVKLSFSVFTQPAIRSGRRHHCKFTLEDRAARREERERETVGWLWTVNDFEPAPPLSICYPNNNYCPFIIRWTMTFPLISTATHRARYDLLTTYRE